MVAWLSLVVASTVFQYSKTGCLAGRPSLVGYFSLQFELMSHYRRMCCCVLRSPSASGKPSI